MDEIRIQNSAILFKIEAAEGVDAAPVAADAVPFFADSVSAPYPFSVEQSNEATGSLVSGAPLIIGQPATFTFRSPIKGAFQAYTALVKPALDPLFLAAGMKGVFTASVAAAALTAGGASQATLAAGFSNQAQAYRGMPLVLSGGPGAGRSTFITDYTAGRVATLADTFNPVLDNTTQAAIPANWTYAGTSPKTSAARLTDQPSGTLYHYEDGVLKKYTGCRVVVESIDGNTARPGSVTWRVVGVFQGQSDAAVPAGIALPAQSAPTLVQGVGNANPALLINRQGLPISSLRLQPQTQAENPDDPNTSYGFGSGILGGRTPNLVLDPLKTLIATRNTLANLAGGSLFPGMARFGSVANNRWAITFPRLIHAAAEEGTRGALRSENITYQALSPDVDPNGRDGDFIICFY